MRVQGRVHTTSHLGIANLQRASPAIHSIPWVRHSKVQNRFQDGDGDEGVSSTEVPDPHRAVDDAAGEDHLDLTRIHPAARKLTGKCESEQIGSQNLGRRDYDVFGR